MNVNANRSKLAASSSNYIAIMAGGIGSRFWPSSTADHPKQFLDILGVGKSLIRLTFERCLHLVPVENILIVTNIRYKQLVQNHLPELPERNILCEPSMNNTAPCVAYTAMHIKARNPEAVFAVLPSDHVILKEKEYIDRLSEAFDFATNNEAIVTLGIQPTRPDTGYGYIETDNNASPDQDELKVISFKEKPNVEVAQQYLDAGNYYWNAGMFVWSVKTIISAYEKYAGGILETLCIDDSKFGTDEEQAYINEVYPKTESISVDYAILEKADNTYTLPADIGWSDLGTWNSLYSYLEKDQNENIVQAHKHHISETKNTLIRAQNERTIVIKGLDNYIVVDEPGALLIYPKGDEQEIKAVVQSLTKPN
ncbi:mannose-1-phosphate guanylyltransferase [Portibacter lacus]|uniref:mannose-1-phosphate guanylyltransferase n=1 Tax=Portibacter lacus TaxID=1099794 RepID=A0AA37WFQ9_9BACT|nr:mannose-1-phosphate guanylyltransferase [Portibacter lacus]GLR18882.1 mannose-1-phosphate guanylyltransferase [Portibacter lacus]